MITPKKNLVHPASALSNAGATASPGEIQKKPGLRFSDRERRSLSDYEKAMRLQIAAQELVVERAVARGVDRQVARQAVCTRRRTKLRRLLKRIGYVPAAHISTLSPALQTAGAKPIQHPSTSSPDSTGGTQ